MQSLLGGNSGELGRNMELGRCVWRLLQPYEDTDFDPGREMLLKGL